MRRSRFRYATRAPKLALLVALASALALAASDACAACEVWIGEFALGDYDPSSHAAMVLNYDIEVRCDTGDLQFELALGHSATSGSVQRRQMRHAFRPETLSYNLYQDAAGVRIWGEDEGRAVHGATLHGRAVVPIYARIDPLQDVWVGDYRDEVVLTVLP